LDNELLLNTDLDLILIKDDIEISEVKDQDLMRVKCFATHDVLMVIMLNFLEVF
jgi:hypothetical protein